MEVGYALALRPELSPAIEVIDQKFIVGHELFRGVIMGFFI